MDTSGDIQELVTSMKEKLDNLSTLSPNCCIFRVPERLRQVNERAYTPIKVSIGPLHHGKDDLKPLEEHKWRYLKDFLQQSQKSLEYLLAFVKEREVSIRECYEEAIFFDSDKFVEIILVDAAFIIEVLLKYRYSNLITSGDRIFGKSMMIVDISPDFLLLENQLPFFVLYELFNMVVFDEYKSTSTLIGLACYFLVGFSRLENIIPKDIDSIRAGHFVDLVRILLTPRERLHQRQVKKVAITTPTAKELRDAGIKFKASSSKNVFDIRFMSGVLKIPKFLIADVTEGWLRNLLAFERCINDERYMTQYVWFLDNLIKSSKDAKYLVESGVIETWIGDNNDVSNLINKLGVETFLNVDNFYFSELCEKLSDYYNKPWHRWEAFLRGDYFKSIFAAAFLLLLTVIQTVCSIVSFGTSVQP